MTPDQIRTMIREEIEQTLGRFDRIPFSVQEALKARIGQGTILSLSTKGADTEDVSINEAGAATHTVLADPTGFLSVEVNGATRNIPYF